MKFKRFFAVLVALIMVISLVPVSAFADEDRNYYDNTHGVLTVKYLDSEKNNNQIGTQTIEIKDAWKKITEDNLDFDKTAYAVSTDKTFGNNGNSITLTYYTNLLWENVYYFVNEYNQKLSEYSPRKTYATVNVYLKSKETASADQWAAFFVIKPDVQDMSVSAGANFYSVGWGKINQRTEKSTLNGATEQDILDLIDSAPSITDSWSSKIDGSGPLPSEFKDSTKWQPVWYRVVKSTGASNPNGGWGNSWHVDGYLKNIEVQNVNIIFYVNGSLEKQLVKTKGSTVSTDEIPSVSTPSGQVFLGWSTDGTEANIVTNANIAAKKYYENTNYYAVFGNEEKVTVSYIASPSNGGTVTRGSDLVLKQTGNITNDVTATENEGFEFVNWTVNGKVVSTDNVLTAGDINSNAKNRGDYVETTFIANFKAKTQYTVTGTIDNNGTVTNANQTLYAGQDSQRMDFKAAEGYYITSITVNGANHTVREYQTEYSFQIWSVKSNWEVVVKTAPIASLTIKFVPNNSDMGSVSIPSQTVKATDTAAAETVTATANKGYKFVEWKLNDESLSTSTSFKPSKPDTGWIDGMTYTAVFAERDKTIIHFVSEDENKGTVNGEANQSLNPDIGTATAVTAVPKDGYEFEGWYLGNEKVGSTAEFKPDRPSEGWSEVTYTAKFTEKKVTIRYEATTGGTVTPASEEIDAVTGKPKGSITRPNEGYAFDKWTTDREGNNTVSLYNKFAPTKADGTVWTDGTTYYAQFKKVASVIKYRSENADYGLVKLNEDGASELGSTSETVYVADNEKVKGATVVPKAGYEFIGWYVDESEYSKESSIKPDKPAAGTSVTYVAKFREKAHVTITVDVNDENMGSVSPSEAQSLNPDNGVFESVAATPKAGYEFVNWVDNATGEEVTTNATLTLTKPSTGWKDAGYTANFREIEGVKIYFESENKTMGTVDKDSQRLNPEIGVATAVKATPNKGYKFVEWKLKDGAKTADTAEFTPTKAAGTKWIDGTTYVAVFAPLDNVTINFESENTTMGTVDTPSQSLNPETGVATAVKAEAKPGYEFDGWYLNNNKIDGANAEFTPVKGENEVWVNDTTYVAKFKEKANVTISYVTDGNGTVTRAKDTVAPATGNVAEKVTAEPISNEYRFVNWTVAGKVVSENAELDVVTINLNAKENGIYKATTFTANFEKKAKFDVTGTIDNGNVTNGSQKVIEGEPSEAMVFTAENGYYIKEVKVNGTAVTDLAENAESYTFAALEKVMENVKVEAVTAEKQSVINYTAEIGGYVSNTTEKFNGLTGTVKGSTATADNGYVFDGWYLNDVKVENAAETFVPPMPTVGTEVTYVAKFEKEQVTINYVAVANGSVTPESETVEALTGLKVVNGDVTDEMLSGSVPTADKGYKFVGWTTERDSTDYIADLEEGNRLVPRPINDFYTNATYYAHFEPLEDVTLSFEVNDGTMGSISPADDQKLNPETGKYETVTAEAKSGYEFVNWTDKATGEELTTDNKLSLIQPDAGWKDATYVANFKELDKALLTFAPNDERFGSVSVDRQELNPQTGVFEEVTAEAKKGYKFVEWIKDVPEIMSLDNKNDEVVSTDPVLKLTKPETGWENGHYIAVFEELPEINVKYVATEGGKVSVENETVSIAEDNAKGSTATADDGYKFVNWTAENGAVVGLNYNFVPKNLEADATFTANFVRKDHKLLVDHIYRINGENAEDLTYSKDPKDVKYGDAFEESMDSKASYKLNRIDVYFGTDKATDEALAAANVNIDLEKGVITGNIPNAQVTVRFIYDFVKNKEDESDDDNGGGGGGNSDHDYSGEEVEIIEEPDVALSDALNDIDHYAYVFGYEDDTVRPNNDITREEVATIFYRLLTDPARDAYFTDKNNFPDVESGRWSNKAISTLSNADIISGYPEDGTFRPANPITRAEFASIVSRFDSLNYNGDNKFNDISGHWASNFINAASEKGWISGYPDGSFKPQNNITRAEAITLINNVLNRHVDSEGLHEDAKKWSDMKESDWFYHAVMEATNSHDYNRETDSHPENWTEINENRTWEER